MQELRQSHTFPSPRVKQWLLYQVLLRWGGGIITDILQKNMFALTNSISELTPHLITAENKHQNTAQVIKIHRRAMSNVSFHLLDPGV